MTRMQDALRIYYVLLLESDSQEDVTAFQLFGRSWQYQRWMLDRLPSLPRDVLEPSYNIDDVIIQRIGGMRQLGWLPLSIAALEELTIEELGVFVVCFTGEDESARRANVWVKGQQYRPLHVTTTGNKEALPLADFSFESLHKHCQDIFARHSAMLSDEQREATEAALANWRVTVKIPSGLRRDGHNIFQPNYMSLDRAARSLEKGSPFIGKSEADYTTRILECCRAVIKVRTDIGIHPVHFLSLIRPGLILAEPAMLRPSYARIKAEGPFKERVVAKSLRMIQKQKGLFNQTEADFVKEFKGSKHAQMIIAERQSELDTFTLGTGVFACQSAAAVMRLSPGVNHVFSSLSSYARHVRSDKMEARLKARRLFDAIQKELALAVGGDRIAFIEEHGGPIKIIADAPVEWLPIGDLPLGLKYDCSRINSTPGNLLMGLLARAETIRVHPKHLRKILIVNAFQDGDPLRNVLTIAIEAGRHQWEGKIEVEFKRTPSIETFVDALNSFDGNILIFDGHGVDNANEPIGKLALGSDKVNVWDLRGKVRVPPIVILSACDTHGIDASSQATVGNGFLAIGALTVLATLLPVSGFDSAGFIGRLVYRISEFIPSVLRARTRVLNWNEVIGGMLRMLFATEVLNALVGPPAEEGTPRFNMQMAANVDINTREDEHWFGNLLQAIAVHRNEPVEKIVSRARGITARAEAIRYVQLGHPEAILIDDGSVRKRLDEAVRAATKAASFGGPT